MQSDDIYTQSSTSFDIFDVRGWLHKKGKLGDEPYTERSIVCVHCIARWLWNRTKYC